MSKFELGTISWRFAALWLSVCLGVGWMLTCVGAVAAFVWTHDRFPHGQWEVVNWVFGLG